MTATLTALAGRDGERTILKSPSPGWFRPAIAHGELISAGRMLGELVVLGRRVRVVAPDIAGAASLATDAPRAVGYGDALVVVDQAAAARRQTDPPRAASTAELADQLVFRAPTSGRYYGRPSPDKPAFVTVGAELAAGTTVCLLEVMKTFNRVTYGGAGLPARARVRALLVADGADVNAGDPLVALDSLST